MVLSNLNKAPLVSIIVPVYMVERYVEYCLESLCSQDYENIEIIVSITKSSDNSHIICEEFASKDKRVKCVYPAKRGLGNARNEGLKHANGDYLCFVDSDDWVSKSYVSEMLTQLIKNESDICECDYWQEFENDKKRIRGNSLIKECFPENMAEAYSAPSVWKYMVKTSVWKEANIHFTNTLAEDLSVYSALFSHCKKKEYIKQPLYHYRIRRESLSFSKRKEIDSVKELQEVLLYAKDNTLVKTNTNWDMLFRQGEFHLCGLINSVSKEVGEGEFCAIKQYCYELLRDLYEKSDNLCSRSVVSFGSYSLARICNYLSVKRRTFDKRFCFSNIISIISKPVDIQIAMNLSEYRHINFIRDIKKKFWNEIRSNETHFIIIDFLEERLGVVKIEESYIANSEILKDENIDIPGGRNISFLSKEYMDLWKNSLVTFMDKLKSEFSNIKIIVIENYLCESFGTIYAVDTFENADEIRKSNDRLREMYAFFKAEYPQEHVVSLNNEKINYTDKDFEYGCCPQYYNWNAYSYLAMLVEDLISEIREEEGRINV